MRLRKDSFGFLLGGIAIGLVIGLAWPDGDSQSEVAQAAMPNTGIAPAPPTEPVEEVVPEPEPKKVTPAKPKKAVKKASRTPVAATIVEEKATAIPDTIDTLMPPDTTAIAASIDSLPPDTTLQAEVVPGAKLDTIQDQGGGERIIVRKEQLIRSLSVRMQVLDSLPEPEKPSATDSALAELSGIQEPVESYDYSVEFWSSPINYQGYKMANNKLVLFGLEDDEEIRLMLLAEEYYFQYRNEFYAIAPTFAFKAFQRIEDEQLVSKLSSDL